MSDGAIKPTSAEIIRESSRREERARAKDKEQPSQFDEVLRQRAQIGQPSAILKQAAQTATEQAVRQERQHDEGEGRQGDREKGEDHEGKQSTEGEKRTDAKTAEQRVVAKHGLKDRGSGGHGGERGGGGGFMGRKDRGEASTRQLLSRHTPVQLRAQFARNLAHAARMPEVFTQHVLNQIVKYVRIGINAEGEKEMRLDLHEKIFRGVRLRVATKGKGKVTVHFTTADAEARETFMKQRDAIRSALAKKGIEVAEITVT